MDMSAATAAAVVNYVPQVNSASVKGGLFYGPTLGKSFAVKATTHFIGTKYADTMTVDTYFPKIKAVTYYGRAGDDELSGGRAADALYGESGKDTLDGKAGIDRMAGGLHDDIYVIDVSADRVIELAGQGKDLVQSTASTFTLPSNVEFLALMGKGNIRGTGNSLANVMAGNDGANILDGKAGNDVIVGAAGADILIGDAGRDILSGGLHNDIFRYLKTSHSAGNLADVITDFDQAGNDRIDLSALIGPTLQYIHNAKFTKAGQVRINDVSGADIVVEVNTSGTSGAELSIWLTKTALGSMSAADFIL
jgi:Ca2+-binding RTX toxin-like protein